MGNLQFTEEQQEWMDWLGAGKTNFLSARAGTGKTSTIVGGLGALGQRPGAKWSPTMFTLVAFNKENQLDLQRAAGSLGAQIATLHSLGYGALRRYNRRLELQTDKVFQLMCQAGLKGKNRRARFAESMRLVSVAKNWGLGAGLVEDKPKEWIALADMYCLYQADLEIAREVWKKSNKMAKAGQVDFDDMVYLPLAWGLGLDARPGMIVDEAQDLSPLNLALLKKTPGKKWYVGDPFQCIYQFRGAGAGSIGELLELETLPLTTCWRCGKEIIQEARKWVGDIRARDGAPAGAVVHEARHVDWTKEKPAALLARNNEDLVDVALALWKAGRPVYILGREFGRALLDALEDIPGDGQGLRGNIQSWAEKKADAYPNQAGHFLSIGRILEAFWETFKGRKRMEANLGTFFSDKPLPGAWILSTIHRAKGKEWSEVWLLDWEAGPGVEPWSQEVERNLHYVAITRARDILHIVPEPWWMEGKNGR